MLIYYTKYAEEKFEILHKYKIFFTKEEIEEVIKHPERIRKKGSYLSAAKDKIKVVYTKQGNNIKIITFYPIK